MTDQIHLAVWRDCKQCNATGFYTIGQAQPKVTCAFCNGQKMAAIYIPLDTVRPIMLLRSIREYVRSHDAAVDELTAELEASGLVPDMPAPAPHPDREGYADGRDHLTDSGTFQPDKYPWCPAGFVPLKLTDPAARDLLAEYARRREPIDAEFARDLLEALDNVPAKFNPDYKPYLLVVSQDARPEDGVTAMVRALLKRACVDDAHQVEYVMNGLVPIFQVARQKTKPSPDLAVAARQLADLVNTTEVDNPAELRWIKLREATAAVLECLEGGA